jgi:hypothetical protein
VIARQFLVTEKIMVTLVVAVRKVKTTRKCGICGKSFSSQKKEIYSKKILPLALPTSRRCWKIVLSIMVATALTPRE